MTRASFRSPLAGGTIAVLTGVIIVSCTGAGRLVTSPSPQSTAPPASAAATAATREPSPTEPLSSPSPSPTPDPEVLVRERLRVHLAAEHQMDHCTHSGEVLMGPPTAALRAIDAEIARKGLERWVSVRPTWWVGSQDGALGAHGSRWWAPGRRGSIWIEKRIDGAWWGLELRRFETEQGHTVWVPGNTLRLTPGDCPEG